MVKDYHNKNKLQQIYTCAKFYMQNMKKTYSKMQIDAIGIVLNKKELVKIDFIEDISI